MTLLIHIHTILHQEPCLSAANTDYKLPRTNKYLEHGDPIISYTG